MGSTVDAEKIATRNRKNKLRLNNLTGSSHSHANIGLLDSINQSHLDNSHTHANKAILDNIPDGYNGSITVVTSVNFTTQIVVTKTITISHGVITSIA